MRLPFLTVAGLALVSGCDARGPESTVTIDTLPSGAVRIVSRAPRWTADRAWRVEPLPPIDPPVGSAGEVINPTSLSWTDDGRLVVADDNPPSIKLFDGDGRLVRTIGRDGEGPGEFRSASAAVRGGTIIVHDPRTRRTSLIDTLGRFRAGWKTTCCGGGPPVALDGGRIAVPALVRSDSTGRILGRGYLDFDSSGVARDSIGRPAGPLPRINEHYWAIEQGGRNGTSRGTAGIPYSPSQVSLRLRSGAIVSGFGADYWIAEGPRANDTTILFSRTWLPEAISADRRRAALEEAVIDNSASFDEAELRRVFLLEHVPETSPAFTSYTEDSEGNLWVRVPTNRDDSTTTLDVFDRWRIWLGQVIVPDAWPVILTLAISRDRLAVVAESADGHPLVARYRLIRPPGS